MERQVSRVPGDRELGSTHFLTAEQATDRLHCLKLEVEVGLETELHDRRRPLALRCRLRTTRPSGARITSHELIHRRRMVRVGLGRSRMIRCNRSTVSGEKWFSPVSMLVLAGTFSMTNKRPSISTWYVTRLSTSVSFHPGASAIVPPPYLEFQPSRRIGFVQSDELDDRPRRIAAMDV